ncbi:putative phospholipid-binding lipoprotein MlaA precursor [Aquimixticola soesokkakensis]|uniref:Putative phospholipid-binding lipoprotein MlaA n=1 Tax=Aquimixticola soesokkakensis TaxID=1519096 RepID=A0A1Y5RH76_9RHOB|nr:VacJ family lipoprotein [Aquimixticola soesokkakensis]SLN16234.1 putative phospholipid-binding lipoprotein MlaA precursor [Aquimixticola soesokkakensis]
MTRTPARFALVLCLTGLGALVAGCAQPQVGRDMSDPYEVQNRSVLSAVIASDTRTLRPVSQAYGTHVPAPARTGLSNVASNLALPAMVVNDILQVKLGDAVQNTARFVVNTTLGLGGLFDPAGQGGLTAEHTDFGETLHVWGFGEGAYLVAPGIGPTTTRDFVGKAVDMVLDPLGYVITAPASYATTGVKLTERFDDRYTYASTIDEAFYKSADPYVVVRDAYLQKRRYELGMSDAPDSGTYDIYEDLYE